MDFEHISVLLEESVEGLAIKPDGIYVDGTAGGAGHSLEIVKRLKNGRLIAIDRDPDAIEIITKRLACFKTATVVQSDFSQVNFVLDNLKIDKIEGMLLDLGVSSFQIDNAERGFSYKNDAPLDMRMSKSGLSAFDIINHFPIGEIVRILRVYGEEKFAVNIARNIEKSRSTAPIETTHQLVDIIYKSIPAKARREGGNPAKRTFQAIRIAVNGELESLSQCLDQVFDRLCPGGRLVIITFHSLEDRMVKHKFLEYTKGCTCPVDFPVCVCHKQPRARLIGKKPTIPSELEIETNSRSKSSKLRILEKI